MFFHGNDIFVENHYLDIIKIDLGIINFLTIFIWDIHEDAGFF